jgi:hypothetical protein
MAHIEAYDDEDGVGHMDPPSAWSEASQPRARPPPSAVGTDADSEAWLAPDTPSPSTTPPSPEYTDEDSVIEAGLEAYAADVDGMHDLMEMATNAETGAAQEAGAGAEASHQQRSNGTTPIGGGQPASKKTAWGSSGNGDADSAAAPAPAAAPVPARVPVVGGRRGPVADNPAQLAVNDWVSTAGALKNKQKAMEARDPRLAPEIEVISKHGGAAAATEQDDLRRDLNSRLRRIRGGVTNLGTHVLNIRAGPEYVGRGLHSSTSQLNLSHFLSLTPATDPTYPTECAYVEPKSGRV